jgi:SAM-dependent methyltransferase
LLKKIAGSLKRKKEIRILRSSNYFNKKWYLKNNPDVATSNTDPFLHYLKFGGFEGRDPGPDFSSSWYLQTYQDVKLAGINPLVHYLIYGCKEGRKIHPSQMNETILRYECPVCKNKFEKFIPLNPLYLVNKKKYNNPYPIEDSETMNLEQYQCPICHASDRERLYALYISQEIEDQSQDKKIRLLDIAPSKSLKDFLTSFSNIEYVSADKYMEGVDIRVDLMNMQSIQSESFDTFICSHVLEHVEDDKIALLELFRILKHGGFGILMVPINLKVKKIDEDPTVTDIAERWRRFGQDDHVRMYSKNGFIQRVKGAGFMINPYGIDFFGSEDFNKYGIMSKSVLYVVEKK